MSDTANFQIKKMDDGTIGIMALSARHKDGSAPMVFISMPADVFSIMVREISDPAFSSFDWDAGSVDTSATEGPK